MKHKFSSMGRVAIALVLALSLSLVMAVPVSADDLTGVSATPDNATATVETTYTIGFTTALTFDIQTVDIVFNDAGFTGTVTNVVVTGIGAGEFSTTDDEDDLPALTYTVTEAAVITAGTAITIAFSGVINPDAAGTYEVTVTTKSIVGAVIDEGTADVTITPKPVSFEVVAGTDNTVTVGEAFLVTITALKVDVETTETGYVGDQFIAFTLTGDVSGPSFEVIRFNNGIGISSQSFIPTVVGETTTIKADATEPTVSGISDTITVNPAALADFTIDAPGTATAGEVFISPVTVTAVDADGNTVEDYTGTVSWTSSDPTATAGAGLPATQALVEGEGTFLAADFILKTVNTAAPFTQTITVTGDGKSADASITVTPAAASQWTVVAAPTSIRADGANASTITATVYDEFGNVATGYDTAATFSTSLGNELSGTTENFDGITGVATATLTSDGVVGTATILVEDSEALLPDKTVTVTLMAPEKLADVWVALPPTGNDANAGTEAEPFATIPVAIAATAEGGIVNVAAGTYDEAVTIAKQLTLKGANYGISAVTGDRGAESIIDGIGLTIAVEISASGVILDGFMITADTYTVITASGSTTDGVQIRNNIIYGATQGIFTRPEGGATASNWVISNNTVAASGTAVHLRGAGTANTISGNFIGAGGISISDTVANTTIENNTISNTNDGGSGVSLGYHADGVTITENTFSGTLVNGNGVKIWYSATKVSTYAIHQNNFTFDGTGSAVNNGIVAQVDATNNWWGDDSGPTHLLNPDGIGRVVTDYVNYAPYLTAPYAEPVAPVTTIDLVAGWNLISLMLIPEDSAIATVLSGLDVNKVAAYSPFQDWKGYDPDPAVPDDLAEMNDGWGYWVDMNTAGTLIVSGYEVCAPAPAVPPDYDLAVGWNLIGFKSTTPETPADYLGSLVSGTLLEAIYGYNASTGYFIPTNLEPGAGYWLAVNNTGTIYP